MKGTWSIAGFARVGFIPAILALIGSLACASPPDTAMVITTADTSKRGTLYVAIIHNFPNPSPILPHTDQPAPAGLLRYALQHLYREGAAAAAFPKLHTTACLSPWMLSLLQNRYLERIERYYDAGNNRIRAASFLTAFGGRTDPWIDLMLTPTGQFGLEEDVHLFYGPDHARQPLPGVSETTFPPYAELMRVNPGDFTLQQKRDLKCWFFLTWFDPALLHGPVKLADGRTVDLSDLLHETEDGTFRRDRPFLESDANRLVAEAYKIIASIVPLYRSLQYDHATGEGNVELITSPFYDPPLPLLYDLQSVCKHRPGVPDSIEFQHPGDAEWHIEQAGHAHADRFGRQPSGMLPAGGLVSENVLSLFSRAGAEWVITCTPASGSDGTSSHGLCRVALPDGQNCAIVAALPGPTLWPAPEESPADPDTADRFIRHLVSLQPSHPDSSRFVAVLFAHGETWETDSTLRPAPPDHHALYTKLQALQQAGALVTVTPSEYLHGNPARGIPAHPVETLPQWDDARFLDILEDNLARWVGEPAQHRAWAWLARVRRDLEETAGSWQPHLNRPTERTRSLSRAWKAFYAAQSEQWFRCYGTRTSASAAPPLHDRLFRACLGRVYEHLAEAKYDVVVPGIPPLMDPPLR
ncbi:hypothetical protein GF324_09860 [bacterium]|nr:hypothetical protein [bacterium]